MKLDVTRPQLASVTGFTVLMLAARMALPALVVNMRLSARDVGGAIMPPGMIMTWSTPGEAMRDMAAVHPSYVSRTAARDARGDQPLLPHMENGVKVFDLETSVTRWWILPGLDVEAYTFNGQLPGPRIRLTRRSCSDPREE